MLNSRGYTLVEVLVVLLIGSLLLAIAVPQFDAQLQRTRRARLHAAVTRIHAAQERYRGRMPRYATLAELGIPAVTDDDRHSLEISAQDADGYELWAWAVRGDSTCRHMRMRWHRLTMDLASGPTPALANPPSINQRCWNL